MYLLHTTHRIKFRCLYHSGIIEIGNSGVIERDVAVLTDSKAYDINRIVGKQLSVSYTFFRCIGSIPFKIMNSLEGQK